MDFLHEYYLSNGYSEEVNGQGLSFFQIFDRGNNRWTPEESKSLDFFLSRYSNLNDLEIVPTEKTRQFLKGQRMVVKQDGKGLVVGVEIKNNTGNNGKVFPTISIADGASMVFKIRIKNPDWVGFTAMDVRQRIPSVYYFDNQNGKVEKKYPSLSVSPPPLEKSLGHEMGALVMVGNKLKEAATSITENSTKKDLRDVGHNAFYASESDRLLVQPYFIYRMPNGKNFKKATVALSNMDGEKKWEKEYESSEPIDQCAVDGRHLDNGEYVFSMNTDGGFSEEKKIIINASLFSEADKQFSTLGVVRIFNTKNNGEFALLNEDGSLKNSTDKFGNDCPVFQVRFRNRSTYRRYMLPRGMKLEVDKQKNKAIDLSLLNDSIISTKKPVPLTKQSAKIPFALKNENDIPKTIFLKNPADFSFTYSEGKYVSDIYLAISDLAVR